MRRVRRTSVFLLIVFVASVVPWPVAQAQPRQAQAGRTPPPPRPETLSVPPVTDPRLPSLYIDLALSADTVALGETATISLTVVNQAPDPANTLVVTLSVPDGTAAVPGPGLLADGTGWRWEQPQLAAQSSATFTAQVRVVKPGVGNALVVRPAVTARGLGAPIRDVGGALVVDRAKNQADGTYEPGKAAKFVSADGTVEVEFPAKAAKKKLKVRHARDPKRDGKPLPEAGRKRGFGTFALTATDEAGTDVHQFDAPVTLTVRYTPEQLQALGIAEPDLTIFWYNPDADGTTPDGTRYRGAWVPQQTTVDPTTRTVTTQVDHFSEFALSDGSSPSKEFIPSVGDWQVNTFTGSASYAYDIEVPDGPAGIAPTLALRYNSAAFDGKTGWRSKQQAGWAGHSWSLDTPSIALIRQTGNDSTADAHLSYALTLDGTATTLLRGDKQPQIAAPDPWNPTHWQWLMQDEAFLRVEVKEAGAWTKGTVNGQAPARYVWTIWAKDGTKYEFQEDLWWGWNYCGTTRGDVVMEPYKWLLTREVDPNGNTINYRYNRQTYVGTALTCASGKKAQGTVDLDAWPTEITWGGNLNGTPDRYRVEFASIVRDHDTQFDYAPKQYGGSAGAPRQTRKLQAVKVQSKPGTTWELIRQYNVALSVANARLSDTLYYQGGTSCTWDSSTFMKLTLEQIQEVGANGTTALPATTLTYAPLGYYVKNSTCFPTGPSNRLTKVDNGYGGTLAFQYDTIGLVLGNKAFQNFRRVTTKTVGDGRGQSATWSYQYQTPAVNTLGTTLNPGDASGQQYPNSATLYFNKYWNQNVDHSKYLVTPAREEFRGHNVVTETAPDGTKTEQYYYQGDVGCVPTTKGTGQAGDHAAIEADGCFQQLRDREALKGREYRTRVVGSDGQLLQDTERQFATYWMGTGSQALSGIWRTFTYLKQTDERAYGPGRAAGPLTKTTTYQYDITNNTNTNNAVYGNLSRVEEYDNGTRVRLTQQYYAVRDDAQAFITDRKWATVTWDTNWVMQAYTALFYDGATDPRVMGTQGRLTRQSQAFDGQRSDVPTTNVSTQDTTYGYDAWGNQTTDTTYAQPGTANLANGVWTFTPPGNGSAATTETTTYDTTFHALPTQVDTPVGNGTVLTERGEYDLRMGLLTKSFDENGSVTEAAYDLFGRQTTLIKPGDSTTLPTVKLDYYDTKRPVQIVVSQQETSNVNGASRPTQRFYDGWGREIQTKQESADGTQNIVVDTEYDGLNRISRVAQARYVDNAAGSATFWDLAPRATTDADMRWTTTTYDGLGRQRRVTTPDGKTTDHRYEVWDLDGHRFETHDIIDANRHRVQYRRDALDRQYAVLEFTGVCGYWGYACGTGDAAWAVYANTAYRYDALDRLVEVQDAKGNLTTMQYDGLGRKFAMRDPDMGAWSYQYDVAGNLEAQTDAKNQTLRFTYDALDRLTSKIYPDGSKAEYRYDENGVPNGKGQRTSMQNATGTTRWQYDARGRTTRTDYSVAGVSGTRVFGFTYDAADRVTERAYPDGEVVRSTYDDGWRQTSACSSLNVCYAQNAQYTALDQPTGVTLGNGLEQRWQYDTLTQRLQRVYVTTFGIFDRSFTYDNVGNVATIGNVLSDQTEHFTYDAQDRLARAWTTGSAVAAYDETYAYDPIGNLLAKGGTAYTYPTAASTATTSTQPHAVTEAGGRALRYDANGNLIAGNGRSFAWTVDNLVASVTGPDGVVETYGYDADGERVTKTRAGTTTLYFEGVWEEEVQTGTMRAIYTLGGDEVAQRTRAPGKNEVVYLHSDQLGSVAVTTNAQGQIATAQRYGPWGTQREGDLTNTSLDYTGQRRDDIIPCACISVYVSSYALRRRRLTRRASCSTVGCP